MYWFDVADQLFQDFDVNANAPIVDWFQRPGSVEANKTNRSNRNLVPNRSIGSGETVIRRSPHVYLTGQLEAPPRSAVEIWLDNQSPTPTMGFEEAEGYMESQNFDASLGVAFTSMPYALNPLAAEFAPRTDATQTSRHASYASRSTDHDFVVPEENETGDDSSSSTSMEPEFI